MKKLLNELEEIEIYVALPILSRNKSCGETRETKLAVFYAVVFEYTIDYHKIIKLWFDSL